MPIWLSAWIVQWMSVSCSWWLVEEALWILIWWSKLPNGLAPKQAFVNRLNLFQWRDWNDTVCSASSNYCLLQYCFSVLYNSWSNVLRVRDHFERNLNSLFYMFVSVWLVYDRIRVENLESSGHKKATMRGHHPFMCTIEYRQDKQNLPRHVVIVFLTLIDKIITKDELLFTV